METGGSAKILGSGAVGAVGAALDAERAAFDAGKVEAVQLPLLDDDQSDDMADLSDSEDHLGLPDASVIVEIQRELACDVQRAVAEYRRRGGAGGRKLGSKNKRTDDFARWLLQFGPHPGLFMMRVLARPTEMLAAELQCKPVEAMDRQLRCAAELQPFFEGKKPVDINVTGVGHMSLFIGDRDAAVDGGMLTVEGDAQFLDGYADEVAENSHLEGGDEGQSE